MVQRAAGLVPAGLTRRLISVELQPTHRQFQNLDAASDLSEAAFFLSPPLPSYAALLAEHSGMNSQVRVDQFRRNEPARIS